ncbi:pseudouridine synthase PUS7 Ecym_2402 [Eremothecium cymbalariae DBVPG|uniref:TRUD domain-containing protein n=1 Tax=Eremothecium cymbalariae (strain CBS 270.75 / DBVPG 7215 / KCTC 17166 / NRRL Y-17582) TaxID=931890 RepID=G8JNR7_ERECY|nr:Hypothetical protein Ecym_2402 [Eremothecium cymbalariae DBVPG\
MSEECHPKRSAEIENHDSGVKRAKIVTSEGIKEADVGITYFLSHDQPGFKGQIKQRYSDFLVNEISNDGSVVYLVDNGFKLAKKEKLSSDALKEQQKAEAIKRQEFKIEDEVRSQLVELLGEEDVTKIEEVYRTGTKMETIKSFEDKATRTRIHQLLRKAFNNELESVTSGCNTLNIALSHRNSRVNKEQLNEQTKDANGVVNWGYGPAKNYIHFTVYKENKDTMDVVNTIAKFLRVPTRTIRYSGTKDRRAVTCQRLCISKLGLDRLNSLNRTLKGITVGGFKFEDQPLNLGDLKGNEFVIVIRDVVVDENSSMQVKDILEAGCSSLIDKGFINYFGMQRFGTFSVSTHEIGRELLVENWKRAAELILAEQENVLPKSKEARKIWAQEKDPKAALAAMPRQCLAENSILHALTNQSADENGDYSEAAYYTAVMKIPRNLRTMYVHAYQSYVWNTIVSKRIELYGLNVVVGDLVLDNSVQETPLASNSEDELETEFSEDLRESQFVRAKALTQEDVDSGNYAIDDVVLPTPGFDVLYPTNETLRNLYSDIMAKDNLDPDNMRRKVRDFSLSGSYRHIIQKPENVDYRVVKYSEDTQQLINTDFEILLNKRARDNGRNYMKDKLDRFVPEKGGQKVAVILKFKLGVSAYATMALRELMKLETSRRGDMCSVKY